MSDEFLNDSQGTCAGCQVVFQNPLDSGLMKCYGCHEWYCCSVTFSGDYGNFICSNCGELDGKFRTPINYVAPPPTLKLEITKASFEKFAGYQVSQDQWTSFVRGNLRSVGVGFMRVLKIYFNEVRDQDNPQAQPEQRQQENNQNNDQNNDQKNDN